MTALVVLATCGPASVLSIWWMHAISRRKPTPIPPDVYVPPPITDDYVRNEWAVITWNWQPEEQP